MEEIVIDEIVDVFINSNIKIINNLKLKEYVTFCVRNSHCKEKCKTAFHHILPKSLFPEYKNLKSHPWNGVYLLHKDHYIAHRMLTKSIENDKMVFAFSMMASKSEDVSPEDYQKSRELISKSISNFWKSMSSEKHYEIKSRVWKRKTDEERLLWRQNISKGLHNRSPEEKRISEIKRKKSRSSEVKTSWYFNILDKDDNIVFNNVKRLKKFCNKNKLPYNSLVKTIKSKKGIYIDINKKSFNQIKQEHLKCIGYRVVKIYEN